MAFGARILADSISPNGVRLITFEVTIPRIVLAEFNTHRILKGMDEDPVSKFSRNSASSRAIPVSKMIKRVMDDPYIPTSWGKNQKGMQAGEEVNAQDASDALYEWISARDSAVRRAENMSRIGIHKQLTNRLLEPFMWHTIIVTATEWDNFFHLRNNPMAHPDIAVPAAMMQELYEESEPEEIGYGEWHLPLIGPEDYDLAFENGLAGRDSQEMMMLMVKISCARCARVSYLTHDGKRDLQADVDLHDKLLESGHMSPFEHVARPMTQDDVRVNDGISLVRKTIKEGHELPNGEKIDMREWDRWSGNFRGWVQYRKLIPGEADILAER